MPNILDFCNQIDRFPPKISCVKIRLVAFLSLLSVTAVAKADTPAMATVEFFQGSTLEATIDIVSVLPGEQGNGLGISFTEEALGFANPPANLIGNAETGFTIQLNNDISTIPYDDILQTIGLIDEISASLETLVIGSSFDPLLQDAPQLIVLAGGANTIVPEPGSATLIAIACGMFACNRRRKD